MCNWETMVKPYPEYSALLAKRGFKVPEYRWDDILAHFTPQDYRDLQVWFNLTWCGHRAREKKEIVRELFRKGRVIGLFLVIVTNILKQNDIPGLHDRHGLFDLLTNAIVHKRDGAAQQVRPAKVRKPGLPMKKAPA